MISSETKKLVLSLVEDACKSGAPQRKAFQLIGISERTLQRWQKKTGTKIKDQRSNTERHPANKLSKEEKSKILAICNSPEYGSLPPGQIVPILCDKRK